MRGVALLDGARELGEGDDGDVQLAGEALECPGDVADLLDAVLAAIPAGIGLHELEVVDDDKVDAVGAGEAPHLGAQLGDGKGGGVVEPDVGAGELAGGADDAALLQLGLAAEAEASAVDPGFGGEEANSELLGRHLEGEEGDVGALVDGGVAGDAERERRLPDAGTGADNDEVLALEAAEQVVEVAEAGLDSGKLAAFGGLDVLVEVGLEDLADVDEVAEVLAAAQALEQLLGAGEDGLDVGGRLVGELEDAGGGVDEAAVGAIALDDLGVELDADAGRELADDVAEVALATDLLEALAAVKLVGDGDLVDRLVALPELVGGLVDPAVFLAEEVGGLEDRRNLRDGLGIDEEGRDDSLLGFDVVRWEALQEGEGHADRNGGDAPKRDGWW